MKKRRALSTAFSAKAESASSGGGKGACRIENLQFDRRVYRLVAEIPYGKVMTYGQLALLLGAPQSARRVGHALRYAPPDLPCHRVVNHAGRLAPGFAGQRALLEAEGVSFTPAGCVELKRCLLKIGSEDRRSPPPGG